MKKLLCLAVGVSLIALMAACGKSGESQPKGQEEVQQEAPAAQPAQEAAAEPAPAQQQSEAPAPAKTQPKEEAAAAPKAEPEPAAPPVKVKKAGLGIIFKGNIEKGTFRVKADNDLIYDLAFSGKDTDASKEFYLEPGQHVMKFVVIDDKGVRGVREETMNFVSGKHQVVRVTVKDTPGALVVEHLE